ncbi:E3 ubiquitin-protein ligase CHFR [Apodemus speciosus]|uniref:E3 ubiquitin-protein ligase CHFR n=1 Tax=Apodemus speciosus TaxID=105296 RepID=A0ABQ0ESH7_APOSI
MRGCDLSFPSNKLVSGDHCKLRVDEKSGEVTLEDTSTNGTVINKLQVVKKQTYPLQSGDIIYLVYRKNEPEHNRVSLCSPGCSGTHSVDQAGLELRNPPASASQVLGLKYVAYLYESLNDKQSLTEASLEANKENMFHVTKDSSGPGQGDDFQVPLSSPMSQTCLEEPQPSTSTSDLLPTASTSSTEPELTSAGQKHSSSSGPGNTSISPKECSSLIANGELSSFSPVFQDREASFSLLETEDHEELEPAKKKMKRDGELDMNLQLLAADQRGNAQTSSEDVRDDSVKPDKMEETLTCIICQDLLHDCVSLQPCMHTFCAACYSGWMERSSLCPTCRCPVERICKNHILNNLVEAYLIQHPDKSRSEEDVRSMDARNKITQDMLQPKVRRSFSDEEGSSEDLLELSDVDSESSDISVSHTLYADSVLNTEGKHCSLFLAQSQIVSWELHRPLVGKYLQHLPAYQQQPRNICALFKEVMPYAPAASSLCLTGELNASRMPVSPLNMVSLCSSRCPGTHSEDQAGLELRNPPASASQVLGLKACATNAQQPWTFLYIPPWPIICACQPPRGAPTAGGQYAPQQCAVCLQPFCHLYWGCTRTGCFGCLAPFCELNLGDKCLDGVLNNNNYESDILKCLICPCAVKAFVEFFERIVTLLQVQKQKSLLAKSCETYEGTDYSLSTELPGNQGSDMEKYVDRESPSSTAGCIYIVWHYRITGNTVLCYCCGLRSFRELTYQYRQNIPVSELPVTVTSRPDCYWGRNCRTQVKAHHAMKFNHICEQTRFKN